MEFNNFSFKKSSCEKYTLRFDYGDYAIFTIDDTGMFNCQSSFGDYAYHWNAFGDNFKEFLCGIDSGYLFRKLCNEDYFDFNKYVEDSKKEILKLRKEGDLTKEQARELLEFFDNGLEDYSSFDMTCHQVFGNSLLNELYCNEVYYSDFCPEKDYDPSQKAFILEIYPKFVEILKKEL